MSFKMNTRIFRISVGLFAYFGPYMVQISALFLEGVFLLDGQAEEVSLIKPGVNFLTMESISMLPSHCDGVLIVAWGEPGYFDNRVKWNKITWTDVKESYRAMKLVLKQYEELTE
mmetsp:Transcript_26414/g.38632  ORF Transcript_26414/g.38632 Transcript_26414/m.38632 type:complete len:115 (+) Transcript_26414:150-494(+)